MAFDAPTQPLAHGDNVTRIYMHNVQLHRAPGLILRVKWIRGYLKKTRPQNAITLDDDTSFSIEVEDGEVAASLDEISHFAQTSGLTSGALSDLRFVPAGKQMVIEGRYRHLFPIRVTGDVSPAAESAVRLHIDKIEFLRIPVKGLLRVFHLKTADLIGQTKQIAVKGDDMIIDCTDLLPPPHIRGNLTQVTISGSDVIEIFGNAGQEVLKREQWRNYLSFKGGSLGFGKLFMTNADMMMIDTSADQWFDLDLDHYQAQMVYGYTRITPEAGLQVFMPDLDVISKNMAADRFNLDWLKNRNLAPPADVMPHGASH